MFLEYSDSLSSLPSSSLSSSSKYNSLSKILYDAGFDTVEFWNWRETEHAHHDDHSQAYIPHMDKEKGTLISLNVEGIK